MPPPSPLPSRWRRSHCCLVPSPTAANTLLLFGGGDGDSDFDDVYYLYTSLPGGKPTQARTAAPARQPTPPGDAQARAQMAARLACGVHVCMISPGLLGSRG